jgi:hypothetical protein
MRTIAAALLATPLALAAVAVPAGAGEIPIEAICGMSPHSGDADGLVAPRFGIFEGAEIWNVTADGQSVGTGLQPGEAARFSVFFLNTDTVTHDIVVRGDLDLNPPPPGFVIKVFRATNGKDVTDKVFGLGGLRFRSISSDTANLTIRIKMQASANPNAFVEAFVTGNYEFASACGDTVGVAAGAP